MKPPIFSCLTSRVTDTGSLYGRFLLGPLPIDISLTVATILRRSLLHNKNTFSIVSAEIEGAIHEYAALAGVQESVLEILLNLGEIVLASKGQNLLNSESQFIVSGKAAKENSDSLYQSKSNTKKINVVKPKGCFTKYSNLPSGTNNFLFQESLNPEVLEAEKKNDGKKDTKIKEPKTQRVLDHSENSIAFLRISGPCIVTAKDINWPDGILCVKPDAYIATLSNNHTLAMRLKITSSNKAVRGENQFTTFSRNSKNSGDKLTTKDQINIKLKNQSHFSFFNPVLKEKNFDRVSFKDELKEKKETSIFFGETSRNVLPKWGNLKLPITSEVVQKETRIKTKSISTERVMSSALLKRSLPFSYSNLFAKTEGLEQNKKEKVSSKITELVSDKPWGIELPVSTSSYPVEKVNFLIERDDQLGGYRHRIIFEIWTNGSISPRQAIFNSIGWIIKLLYNFREPTRTFKNF